MRHSARAWHTVPSRKAAMFPSGVYPAARAAFSHWRYALWAVQARLCHGMWRRRGRPDRAFRPDRRQICGWPRWAARGVPDCIVVGLGPGATSQRRTRYKCCKSGRVTAKWYGMPQEHSRMAQTCYGRRSLPIPLHYMPTRLPSCMRRTLSPVQDRPIGPARPLATMHSIAQIRTCL